MGNITLEQHGILGSNFAYLFIITCTVSSHWYANQWQGFAERNFGLSRYFSEVLITLKPYTVYFYQILHTYTYIATLSRQWSSDLYRLTLFGMLNL